MLKLLCYLTLFSSIAKPGAILPGLADSVFFVLAASTSVLFVARRFMHGEPLGSLPQRKYVYSMLVVYALSIAGTGWLGGTIEYLLFWLKIGLLFTLVVDTNETVRDLRRAVLTVVIAVAVLTWAGWDIYLNRPELLTMVGRLESVGDYNLSNSFALALTVGTAFAFALFETERGFMRTVVLGLVLCAFAVSCVYTKSRGGNLGLGVAIIVSIALSRRIRFRWLKTLLIGGMIATAAMSVPFILSRSDVTSYLGAEDEGAQLRLDAMWAGLHMIRDHPLLGVGDKQFPDRVRDYGLDRPMLAHNTLLSVTAETGIFGGLLFVLIIYTTLATLWRVWRQCLTDPASRDLASLAQGVLVALVAFLVNTSFSVKDHDPLFWAILGIAGSTVVVHKRLLDQAAAAAENPAGSPSPPAPSGPSRPLGAVGARMEGPGLIRYGCMSRELTLANHGQRA